MSRDVDRREFLGRAGLLATAGAALACNGEPHADAPPRVPAGADDPVWQDVRAQFALAGDYIHMSALLIVSHPRPVREAIERHRRALDDEPVAYLRQNNRRLQDEARRAAARYIGARTDDVALTDSTTMGIGLLYNGLMLRPGQEILTTEQDYFVTHESVRLAAERTGATVREMTVFDRIEDVSVDGLVTRIISQIGPATRVLALTWVHSNTGLKLPLAEIGEAVARSNANREEEDRVLVCVDGVHGFGIEADEIARLDIDFLAAGCHKWLFGPRGTGILSGSGGSWAHVRPTIPSFIDDGTFQAWIAIPIPPAARPANG